MFDLGLTDKVAIITGGTDGLGRATAERLAAEGALVTVCGRREDHLNAVVEEMNVSANGRVNGIRADVTVADDCKNLIAGVVDRHGGVDILINNAGTSAAAGFEQVDDEAWAEDIELKIMGAVRTCRGVIPHMKRRGGGAIINATIGGGKSPGSGKLPTTVTRAAGINLTKSLANEYAADGIRVNTICIGLIKSEQWVRRAAAAGVGLDDFYQNLASTIPAGRMGESAEYADLAAFLVSERGAYITGAAINLDGGLCAVV